MHLPIYHITDFASFLYLRLLIFVLLNKYIHILHCIHAMHPTLIVCQVNLQPPASTPLSASSPPAVAMSLPVSSTAPLLLNAMPVRRLIYLSTCLLACRCWGDIDIILILYPFVVSLIHTYSLAV
jgi:hypothetical protein